MGSKTVNVWYNIVMTDTSEKKQPNRDHLFKKGVSGNPNGRPKGSLSAIGKVKKIFTESPEKFEEFIDAYIKDPSNRKHVVEMIDGKPTQKQEIKSEVSFLDAEVKEKIDNALDNILDN